MQREGARQLSVGAQILADIERGFGILLLVPGAVLAGSFLFRWDGHVGAILLVMALLAIAVGASLVVAGTALQRGWRGRWLLQAPPIVMVAAGIWLLR